MVLGLPGAAAGIERSVGGLLRDGAGIIRQAEFVHLTPGGRSLAVTVVSFPTDRFGIGCLEAGETRVLNALQTPSTGTLELSIDGEEHAAPLWDLEDGWVTHARHRSVSIVVHAVGWPRERLELVERPLSEYRPRAT